MFQVFDKDVTYFHNQIFFTESWDVIYCVGKIHLNHHRVKYDKRNS